MPLWRGQGVHSTCAPRGVIWRSGAAYSFRTIAAVTKEPGGPNRDRSAQKLAATLGLTDQNHRDAALTYRQRYSASLRAMCSTVVLASVAPVVWTSSAWYVALAITVAAIIGIGIVHTVLQRRHPR